MIKIKTEKEYNVVMERIEELLGIVNNETPIDNKDSIELGKIEPTYQVARSISKNLNIDASIVL